MPGTRVQPHGNVRKAPGVGGPLAQPCLRARVGDYVAAFGVPDVGGNGHRRHPGDKTAGDGKHGGGRRSGQHRNPPRAADSFGHRRRGTDKVAAAQRGKSVFRTDSHRVAEVGTGRHRGGVQRGQQHASEATRGDGRDTGGVGFIERVASREIYRNRWMVLREDDIRRPDGSLGIYSVVDKPTFALVVPYDGQRFGLVEQFRYPVGARRWEFPQGTAPEFAHMEPRELAERELREETGLHAASFEALGQLDVAPGMSSQRGWVFLATGITEGESDREHEEQDMRSAWFSRADVEQMISSGVITDAQTIAAYGLFALHRR